MLFNPVKLKKKAIVWYTYTTKGMHINTYKPEMQGVKGVKHTAQIQPLYWFPFAVEFIKCNKQNLAISASGRMVSDVFIIRFWAKNKIKFDIVLSKTGFIMTGFDFKRSLWVKKYETI
jgi:hypothetical protein